METEISVVLLGDAKVGKTNLAHSLSDGTFSTEYMPTTGVEYDSRILEVDGAIVKVHLWDVSGKESFLWVAKKHMVEADAFAFVYDITEKETLASVSTWLRHMERVAKAYNLPKILLGNKFDLIHQRVVSASEAKELAIPEGMSHIEVSARTGRNLSAAFYMLAADVLRWRKLGTSKPVGSIDYPYQHVESAFKTRVPEITPPYKGPEYTHIFKLLLLGSKRVGKTALRFRFCRDYFTSQYLCSAGFDHGTRDVVIDQECVNIQVWDISGDEVYNSIRKNYYNGANGFLIVYDVTSKRSFQDAEQLLKELDMYGHSDAPKILLGNKCDMASKRKVDFHTAKEFADGWRIPMIDVSASLGSNVDNAFLKIALALKRKLSPWKKVYNFS